MSFHQTLGAVELTSAKAINASITPLVLGAARAGAYTEIVAKTIVSKKLI